MYIYIYIYVYIYIYIYGTDYPDCEVIVFLSLFFNVCHLIVSSLVT